MTKFTAKRGLLFVLTQGNAYLERFLFKANRKNIGSSENGTRDFQNSPS